MKEVKCLKRAKHKNIVRFLGYCADTRGEIMEYDGRHVLAEIQERLLCFEYVPNGNLGRFKGIKIASLLDYPSFNKLLDY